VLGSGPTKGATTLSSPPLAHHGHGRKIHHLGSLFDREAAEEAQFCNPALSWVNSFEFLQRLIKREEFFGPLHAQALSLLQSQLLSPSPALRVSVAASAVNQDVAHNLRGDGEEVLAVMPFDTGQVNQPDVSLVY
jgi:hypothetical protein